MLIAKLKASIDLTSRTLSRKESRSHRLRAFKSEGTRPRAARCAADNRHDALAEKLTIGEVVEVFVLGLVLREQGGTSCPFLKLCLLSRRGLQ